MGLEFGDGYNFGTTNNISYSTCTILVRMEKRGVTAQSGRINDHEHNLTGIKSWPPRFKHLQSIRGYECNYRHHRAPAVYQEGGGKGEDGDG